MTYFLFAGFVDFAGATISIELFLPRFSVSVGGVRLPGSFFRFLVGMAGVLSTYIRLRVNHTYCLSKTSLLSSLRPFGS